MKTTPPQETKRVTAYNRQYSLAPLLTVVLLFFNPFTYAQSTCATAVDIGSSNADTAFFSGSDVWFKFQASDTEHRIRFGSQGEDTPSFDLTLYSGTCSTLTQEGSVRSLPEHNDIIDTEFNGLTTNDYYYLKFSTSNTGQTFVQSASSVLPCSCIDPPDNCERVCNGDFEDLGSPGYATGLFSNDVERACPWNKGLTANSAFRSTPDHYFQTGLGLGVSSDGILGFSCGSGSGFTTQEYAYIELQDPILPGESALVSYYIE
ncbi:hypothetical protein HZ996_00840 [Cryomorphaceae bacterium]|nr:hypothetical protein HZ996_00840 [Cryomorphaceae bacterium]